MGLVACPACDRRVSEIALACPSCGHPGGGAQRSGVLTMLGCVAGTYVSTTALTEIVLGSVFVVSTAAVLITLILTLR